MINIIIIFIKNDSLLKKEMFINTFLLERTKQKILTIIILLKH